ncbi:TadE/TadG family type IV pilus assembly protein [Borborobacter arsenicus]|nr:TadE/TadG family type IV pilus assembly protein [Pseudaminobacter arsenicus]
MVEMTLAVTLLLILTLGFVDLGHAYFQWNAATKAVQVGARLASISDPVATAVTKAGPIDVPGRPMVPGDFGPFECKYTGSAPSCSNGSDFSPDNFSRIFRGDVPRQDNDSCTAPGVNQRPGICHFFPGLRRNNVVISYSASGLGYQTRQAGTVPTITVSLQNVNFQFFFLNGLLGFGNIVMPSMLSTVTGEDMRNGPPA